MAMIIMVLTIFNVYQLLSPQAAGTRLDYTGSNVSLTVCGCMQAEFVILHATGLVAQALQFHASIMTGVPSSTRSNSSITSAFRILTQPQLSGVPILCSCFVPWM